MTTFIKQFLLLITISLSSHILYAQKPAYQIYDKNGKAIQYDEMIKSLTGAQAVFFGEFHDQPISHWLQKEVLFDMYKMHGSKLAIGAEMFESDNQTIIDEYFLNFITQKKFEEEARLWKNYKTDYKAILEFAKEKNISFIASNVPGRYANMVFNKGLSMLDSLSAPAKRFLPPLPIHTDLTIPCYAEMLEMNMGHSSNSEYFAQAQALRDATMAYFISPVIQNNQVIYHLNGSYHSNKHEGIVYYLKRSFPDLQVMVISTVTQDDITKLESEHINLGDFILCVQANMTKSY